MIGDRCSGSSTLVAELIQQDEFIRDVCFVDMVLWMKMNRPQVDTTAPNGGSISGSQMDLSNPDHTWHQTLPEFDDEQFFRAIARLLQLREPSANAVVTKEQKTALLERKLKDTLADRSRPIVLVIEEVSWQDHSKIAACIEKLKCSLLKCIIITKNQSLVKHPVEDNFALLHSFGDYVGMVKSSVTVKPLSKGKLATLFQQYWSKPMLQQQSPLEAFLSKSKEPMTFPGAMLDLPSIEDLAEIYVGRPSLVANILYVALKSCFFEQDLQECFYGFVGTMKQRRLICQTNDPHMPPKPSPSEANIFQVLKFVLDKEPKDFKRKYFSFLIFDDNDVIQTSQNGSRLGVISENQSVKTSGSSINEEVAVAIVWNPYKNRYENDLLLKAFRKLGLTRTVGKFNYEVVLLVFPNSMTAQLSKPDFQMAVKPRRLLSSLVNFRSWFLSNSLVKEDVHVPNDGPPTHRSNNSRNNDRLETETVASTKLTGPSTLTLGESTTTSFGRSKWNKGKKRVVVAAVSSCK